MHGKTYLLKNLFKLLLKITFYLSYLRCKPLLNIILLVSINYFFNSDKFLEQYFILVCNLATPVYFIFKLAYFLLCY
jgi:hypothetical protein